MTKPDKLTESLSSNQVTFMPGPFTTPLPAENTLLASTTISKIAPALVKAQRKMGMASKDAKNPFFKSSYADLNSIREAYLPALLEENIAVLQPTVVVNGKNYVRTVLLHDSGEWLACDTEIVVAKQNDPQAAGSGISYTRRYGSQSFLNVGAGDDDGEAAMNRSYSKAAQVEKAENTNVVKPAASFRAKKTTELKPVETTETSEWNT